MASVWAWMAWRGSESVQQQEPDRADVCWALTVSAAVEAVGDASRNGWHQSVLDGHLPHPSHILPHAADLKRHNSLRVTAAPLFACITCFNAFNLHMDN